MYARGSNGGAHAASRIVARRRFPDYPNTSPPEPTGPRYSARVALSCERGHAPGQVLHALQGLRSMIDDRLRSELGLRYDRHTAASVGTDKLTVTFTLRANAHADAIRSRGAGRRNAGGAPVGHATAVDLSGVALVVARSVRPMAMFAPTWRALPRPRLRRRDRGTVRDLGRRGTRGAGLLAPAPEGASVGVSPRRARRGSPGMVVALGGGAIVQAELERRRLRRARPPAGRDDRAGGRAAGRTRRVAESGAARLGRWRGCSPSPPQAVAGRRRRGAGARRRRDHPARLANRVRRDAPGLDGRHQRLVIALVLIGVELGERRDGAGRRGRSRRGRRRWR